MVPRICSNGKPVTDITLLEDGDIIQVALSQQFVYLSSDATVPLDISEIDHQGIRYEPEDMHARPERTKSPTGRLRLDRHSRRVWIFAPKNITSTEDVLSNYNFFSKNPLNLFHFCHNHIAKRRLKG